MIRSATPEDAPAIRDIYAYYVTDTVITFETSVPSEEEMARRVRTISSEYPYLVMETDGEVTGYAYASRWKTRAAYDRTVEISVYVREGFGGRGVGSALYERLLGLLQARGIHAVVAVIALPNEPSRRLHEKFGFRDAGRLPEVGLKFGRWIDVGYWILTIDAPAASQCIEKTPGTEADSGRR